MRVEAVPHHGGRCVGRSGIIERNARVFGHITHLVLHTTRLVGRSTIFARDMSRTLFALGRHVGIEFERKPANIRRDLAFKLRQRLLATDHIRSGTMGT